LYRPYKTPVIKVFPDIKLPEPGVSKFAISLVKFLARPYLFLFIGMARVVLHGEGHLFQAFKRALAGESRCIAAFRHPCGMEPQILSWFFLFKLKALATRGGIRFVRRPHAVFVYGYEVARWGGALARFVMPRLGALPVHHAKLDSKGMDRIYRAIIDGLYPLALAPEGQVSYSADSVPRLEPGLIRIGFQAAQRIEDKGAKCPVEILPVSFHFRYGRQGRAAMERLLAKIEEFCGFSGKGRKELPLVERLRRCRERILETNEARYGIKSDDSLSFEDRLEQVINAALETAERMAGLKSEGELFARMYALRHICWDRIVMPETDSLESMPPVMRSMNDLRAGEAWYINRHQEIVDFCWYFRVPLPPEDATLHAKVEYVQNLFDFANRSMGGAFSNRVYIFPKKVIIQAAPPINLTERLPSYREDKKAAVAQAMGDLLKSYLHSIDEMKGEQNGKQGITIDG
jgi:hypothetical protein